MLRKLVFARPVYRQLSQIRDYYADINPQAGSKIFAELSKTLSKIKDDPKIFGPCHLVPTARAQRLPTYP